MAGVRAALLLASLMIVGTLAGCVDSGDEEVTPPSGGAGPAAPVDPNAHLFEGPWKDHPEAVGLVPIDTIFGGSISKTLTRVAVVPPMHGDLTNPVNGPTVLDYLDATLLGMHGWVDAMDRFAEDYPEYAYLREIEVEVEILDQQVPSVLGYDVVVGYVHSGDQFRGVASGPGGTQPIIDDLGLGDNVHYANRYILLSLFASAPRAGQDIMDFPEYNDLWSVTMHEFAHTFGLGHTLTWTPKWGPDLMNSPYPLIYGDGDPAGDGGERTHLLCITTLNLVGMAELYRWIPNGTWEGTSGPVNSTLPYEWYCPDGHEPPSFKDELMAGQTEFLFSSKR